MDDLLEKSIKSLENATSTPNSLFKASIIKRKVKPEDLSKWGISLLPGELEYINLTGNQNVSVNTVDILADLSGTFSGSVIKPGSPWKNTVDNLFVEFADILQIGSDGSELLEILTDFGRCCSDALSVVQKLKSTVAVSEVPEEKWLESERNTWRLLLVLYQDRLRSQSANQSDLLEYVGISEKNCVNCLFKKEYLVRESQLVIDWLERNALERDDPILHHSDWAFGWEHTLHQLLAPEAIAIGSTMDIVTNIHPDAPHFQNKSLHHLDVANEKKLCQRIFMEIRCGNLERAQEISCNTGHPWRAAMLEGWKLYHDPNIEDNYVETGKDKDTKMDQDNTEQQQLEDYKEIEGNSSRDLWKVSAIEYCKNSKLNIYEKATVASLCGYLQGMLPVCNTWEDYLWAYMRTMVDIKVESEIRDVIKKDYLPLPEEYWEQKLSLNDIFSVLESSKNTTVASQSQDMYHVIQKHIILDETTQLVELLSHWIKDPATTTQSLRFFAHIVICFDYVGDAGNRNIGEKVLEAYINKLSEMNETRLVAFYVSKLRKEKQVTCYAKHLENILENNARKVALEYGEEFGLDTYAVTEKVVQNICNQPLEMETATTNLQRKLTSLDELKISALDWLIFYENQRVEALSQTNALIFKFLTMGKLEAAHLAITKIPSDSVEKILSEGEDCEEVNETIRGFLSYKAYLDAHESFSEWFKQFKNKPAPPANIPENAQFTEKVAHEHRVSQYKAELERWKLTTSHIAKTTKTLLYNVLLFPRGWLVGETDGDYLRSICIPEVVLLLYSILSESELHEEAVKLADLVASEKSGLYKVYSKEKLGELLEKISESSVALLNAGKDPWGNPVTA